LVCDWVIGHWLGRPNPIRPLLDQSTSGFDIGFIHNTGFWLTTYSY